MTVKKLFIQFLASIVQIFFKNWMMEVLEISSISTSSDLCEFTCDFSARIWIFGAENCLVQQDIECGFYNSDFQPSNSKQKLISKPEISFPTPSICLVNDFPLLEQPTSPLLEGVNDVFITDFPCKRHIFDDFQVDDDMPCAFFITYFSHLQH